MATLTQPGVDRMPVSGPVPGPASGSPSGSVPGSMSASVPSSMHGQVPGDPRTAAAGDAALQASAVHLAGHLPGHLAVPGSPGSPAGELLKTSDLAETGLNLPTAFVRLPVGLTVSVPVRTFRVRHLLAMIPGTVIETQWGHGEDLPLAAGEIQLAWSEFEVVDRRLAVRVTRLA